MTFKHSLLLIILSCFFFQSKAFEGISPFTSAKVLKDSCELGAPINFHVEGLGPDWAKFAWETANPNVQHRIRLYRASDSLLLSTTIVPSGNGEATISIPPMTDVYGVANAICTNGINSNNVASTFPFHGVILDLIVIGYQGSSNAPVCNFQLSGSCPVENTSYTSFRVKLGRGLGFKNFDIERNPNGPGVRYYVWPQTPNSTDNGVFNFYCFNQGPICAYDRITVTYKDNGVEQPVASFHISEPTQTTTYLVGSTSSINGSPVIIERLTPFGGEGDKPSNVSSQIQVRNNFDKDFTTNISPNPFNDLLNISFEQTLETPQTIQLFSSEGRLALQETIPTNQSSHTLSTAHLAPGFYFLRIEADGEVQTFKVIKSAQ